MNRTTVIENYEAAQLKNPSDVPDLRVGDTVDIHYRIIEGDKERVQRFQGVLISLKGRGINPQNPKTPSLEFNNYLWTAQRKTKLPGFHTSVQKR